jgi:thymidylate synthase
VKWVKIKGSKMQTYLDLLKDVMENGVEKEDRTGTGTYSVFGRQIRFNLQDGFPMVTTKRLHWKSIAHELFWMLNGSTNNAELEKYGVTIWKEWADGNGELGPVYGKQWRSWQTSNHMHDGDILYGPFETIDQIRLALNTIKNNPDSRRNIVSAWHPADISKMKLPPCHMSFQFYVTKGRLSCHMYQRSADIFLGVPFNIASYALLTHLMAYITNLDVGELIISFGDLHIYKNHLVQVQTQLKREPKNLPKLELNFDKETYKNLYYLDEAFEDGKIKIINYEAHPSIKAEVAV